MTLLRRLLASLSVSALLAACSPGVTNGPPGTPSNPATTVSTWAKSFGGDGDDIASGVTRTADGGYLFVGQRNGLPGARPAASTVTGNDSSDLWVVKLDSLGDVVWERLLGAGSAQSPQTGVVRDFRFAVGAADGGAWLLGQETGGAPSRIDIVVARLDADGGVVWAHSFDSGEYPAGASAATDDGNARVIATVGEPRDEPLGAAATDDGGLVLVARVDATVDTSDHDRVAATANYVLKLNAQGDALWRFHHRLGPLNSENQGVRFISGAPDNRALLVLDGPDGVSFATLIGGTASGGGRQFWETEMSRFQPSAGAAFMARGTGGSQIPDGFAIGGARDWFTGFEQPLDDRFDGAIFRLRADGSIEWVEEMDDTEDINAITPACDIRDADGRCGLIAIGRIDHTFRPEDGVHTLAIERWSANGEVAQRETLDNHGVLGCGLQAIAGTEPRFLAIVSDRPGQGGSHALILNALLQIVTESPVAGTGTCNGFGDSAGSTSLVAVTQGMTLNRVDPATGRFEMLNADGSSRWARSYNSTGGDRLHINRALGVVATDDDGDGQADDGYLLAAEQDNESAEFLEFARAPAVLLKLNANGELTWQRRFPELSFSLQGLGALDAIAQSFRPGTTPAPDGFAFVASYHGYEHAGSMLVRLNPDGTTRWTAGPFHGELATAALVAALAPTADGGFALAGGRNEFQGLVDGWMARVDVDGAVTWRRRAPAGMTSIRELANRELIAAGIAQDMPFAMKLSADGTLIWSRRYDFTHSLPSTRGMAGPSARIQPTSDGFILGTTITPLPKEREGNPLDPEESFTDWVRNNRADNIALLKLNAEGRTVWSRNYGGLYNDALTSMQVLPDDGILVGAYSDSLGTRREAWVMRLGANGAAALGCNAELDANTYLAPTDFASGMTLMNRAALPAVAAPAQEAASFLSLPNSSAATSVARQCSGAYDNALPSSPLPGFTLRVTQASTATGVVTSVPFGIVCGTATGTGCDARFASGSLVVLSPDPLATTPIRSWIGCDRVTNGRCEVTMTTDRTVSADFNDAVTFSLTIPRGQGRVTGDAGIDCVAGDPRSRCATSTSRDSTLLLTAVPAPGRQFLGWGGACTTGGTNKLFAVTLDASKTCTAQFSGPPPGSPLLSITLNPGGVGRVVSTPAGIACLRLGDRCAESFAADSDVQLNAEATAPGWEFDRYLCNTTVDGDVHGSQVTAHMSGGVSCVAYFSQGVERLHLRMLTDAASGSNDRGRVYSDPAGIDCRSSCDRPIARDTLVELHAENSGTFVMSTWHGCESVIPNGLLPPICRVRMSARRDVIAVFSLVTPNANNLRTLAIAFTPGSRGGVVTSFPGAIDCGPDGGICALSEDLGTDIDLRLALGAGVTDVSHDGCDTYTAATATEPAHCRLDLLADRLVTWHTSSNNQPPVAAFDYLPLTPLAGQPIVFDASPSSDDTGIIAYRWDFTDNGSIDASGITQNTTFSTFGDRTVRLQVEDIDGAITEFRRTIFVAAGASSLVRVQRSGTGTGTVTSVSGSTGIDCGLDCEEYYQQGRRIELLAVPAPDSAFGGWSQTANQCNGGVTSSGTVCVVNIGADDLILDAPFQAGPVATVPLDISFGTGSAPGAIVSTPAGIDCTDQSPVGCSASFTQGSSVTLLFTSRAGSLFTSQSGCDQFNADGNPATNDCRVDLTTARTITVLFTAGGADLRWRQMGTQIVSMTGGLQARSVVLDSQGRAVVAYRGGDSLIYVSRWDGSAWTAVGGALNTVLSITGSPSLDLDAGGQPVVAWEQGNLGQGDVRVASWNGTAWVGVGAGAIDDDLPLNARSPSLRIAPDGPVVAWVEADRVIVKHFIAGAWTNYGTDDGPPNGDGAAQPSLAIGPDGTPFVAWAQYAAFPGEGIRVAHGGSTGWTTLGSFVNPPQFTDLRTLPYMQLAVGADAAPMVAYSGYAAGVGVEVRKWNGVAWNLLGNVPVDSTPSSLVRAVALSVTSGSDQPIVAWFDHANPEIHVRRFAGGSWNPVGDGQMTPGADINGLGLADGAEPVAIYPISNLGSTVFRGYRYGPP